MTTVVISTPTMIGGGPDFFRQLEVIARVAVAMGAEVVVETTGAGFHVFARLEEACIPVRKFSCRYPAPWWEMPVAPQEQEVVRNGVTA